jgi:hypothetical protein
VAFVAFNKVCPPYQYLFRVYSLYLWP